MNIIFNIECEMEERWVEPFLSMLSKMEDLGISGSSRIVGMYADGDGDFKPKFKHNMKNINDRFPYPEHFAADGSCIYDADYLANADKFEEDLDDYIKEVEEEMRNANF